MALQLHETKPVVSAGIVLKEARVALVLLHGRGADPTSMVTLANQLDLAGTAVLIPTAAERRWYPQSFLLPPADNEPDLSSALAVVSALVARCEEHGIGPDKVVIGGFSQGACLAAEWVARNPRRYGGLVVLSGGLLGPLGELPRYAGSLAGTPVLAGCSDVDPWIPLQRFDETAAEFTRLGAVVDAHVFPNADHSINPTEVALFKAMLQQLQDAR